jgi:anthranilate synthase component 2
MTEVLIIDNYDSFTFNLVHYLEDLNCKVTVYRNDQLDLDDVKPFHKIVLSPGPGLPEQAGILKQIIKEFAPTKSILGVCLGQQAIAEVFGGSLVNLEQVFHGVASTIKIVDQNEPLFTDLPDSFEVGRYHSWVVNLENFPEDLLITSVDQNNHIMSLRHKIFDVCAVQFHPESILTSFGKTILKNWLAVD